MSSSFSTATPKENKTMEYVIFIVCIYVAVKVVDLGSVIVTKYKYHKRQLDVARHRHARSRSPFHK